MDQGKDFGKGMGMVTPPIFEPNQDVLVWRKKVASWVDLIDTAASKGSDTFYKTVFCTLGRQLYNRGLRQAEQSLVDEAQEQGKINYKQDNQVKAVQEIVDLIAEDSPIAVVTRLIDSFNRVTSCKRKPNEDLNRFVARFRGLAREHLMRAGTSNHSQMGEVLTINLLNNALLSEASLTNAKLRLTGLAEDRAKVAETDESKILLNTSELKKLLQRVSALRKVLNKIREHPNTDASLAKEMETKYDKVALGIMPVHRQVTHAECSSDVTRKIASTGPRCILSLDDAVAVLSSLAQTGSKTDQVITKAQMNSAMDHKMRNYFSNQKNSQSNAVSGQNRPRSKHSGTKRTLDNRDNSSARRNRTEHTPKKLRLTDLVDGACLDCGSKSHFRGSAECKRPSFATSKLQEAKSGRGKEEGDGDSPNDEGGYFRPDSKRTKGNGAS